jgi:hypothetical protein
MCEFVKLELHCLCMVLEGTMDVHVNAKAFQCFLVCVWRMRCVSGFVPLVIISAGSFAQRGIRDGCPLIHCQYWTVHEHFAKLTRLPPEI